MIDIILIKTITVIATGIKILYELIKLYKSEEEFSLIENLMLIIIVTLIFILLNQAMNLM